jgi:hypothetical protein
MAYGHPPPLNGLATLYHSLCQESKNRGHLKTSRVSENPEYLGAEILAH